jgi:hypothetical protein
MNFCFDLGLFFLWDFFFLGVYWILVRVLVKLVGNYSLGKLLFFLLSINNVLLFLEELWNLNPSLSEQLLELLVLL